VNRVREGLRIKIKARGLWAKAPFFFPRSRTGEGGRGGLGRRRAAASQGSAAAGDRGETERGPRGSQPRAHLGLGLLVEVAPRRGLGGGAIGGGGGAREGCEGSMVRRGAARSPEAYL
jgi:hypothetical protein